MTLSRFTLVPLVVACALFMEQMDGSIIATALPRIAQSLQTDPVHLNMAITSYLFSLAVFIPLSGWMADRYGARTVFMSAIIVFTVSSIACGLSMNLGQLVIARMFQGAGGAMMVPVGRLVLLRTVPKTELVNAMAWVTAPALIGPVLGPPVGGLIVTYASWRWIFLVNVPIGILGYMMARKYIENSRGDDAAPLDLRGFILVALTLSGLVFSFETVGRHLVSDQTVAGLFAVGVVAGLLYMWHAHRIENPIIDFKLFRYPTYRASLMGGSLFRISIGSLPFLLPMLMQYGFGMSPALSGFVTLSSAAGAVLMKLTTARLIRALGFRPILILNSFINAVFLVGVAGFTQTTPLSVIFIALMVGGLFRSLQFTALNTIAFAEIPEHLLSRANTFYNMMQQLSFSLGVALGALLLNLTQYWRQDNDLRAEAFWPSFIVVSLLCFASIISYVALDRDAGAEVSGHRRSEPSHEDHV